MNNIADQADTAVIYCRVSTKSQVELSNLEFQEKECRLFCENKGFRVLSVFQDI